jgi:hypothetical protein
MPSMRLAVMNGKKKTTEEARAQVIALGHVPGPGFKYENASVKMQLVCPNGSGFYYMLMCNIAMGKGCSCKKCCPALHPKTTEEARTQVITLGHIPGPEFIYENCKSKMQLVCPNGSGYYYMIMSNITVGHGCNCDKCCPTHVSKTTEEARAQVVALGRIPGPDFKYKNNRTKMQLICPNGVSYYMKMNAVVAGHGCDCNKCCPTHVSKTTEEAMTQITALGYIPGPNFVYKNNRTGMQLICPNGTCYFALMGNIRAGKGCNCKKCNRSHFSKTTEEARAQVIALGYIPGPNFAYENNRTKMQLICANSGCFYHKRMDDMVAGHSCDCDMCAGLKREPRCRAWFENRFQKIFSKTRPSWLLNNTGHFLELDGYCEELKLAFEHHGVQHYKPCRFSASQTEEELTKKFEDQQRRDALKFKLCTSHGVRLVVIPYYEKNIEEFLEKQFTGH